MSQEFIVQHVNSVSDVIDNMTFFSEGLFELNESAHNPEDRISMETLLKTLLYIATLSSDRGMLVIIRSKTGKELFWGAALDNTIMFKPKSCCVYAAYSNKKAPGVVSFAIQYLEDWARRSGYTRIMAFTPCFSGSRFRLFEKIWKFRRSSVVFTKSL